MRISKMTLQEYGPFKDASFEFPAKTEPESAEIHIFTGPNGCGKSSALYALAALFGGPEPALARIWGSSSKHICYQFEEGQDPWTTTSITQLFYDKAKQIFRQSAKGVVLTYDHYVEVFSPPLPKKMLGKLFFAYAGKRNDQFGSIKSILAGESKDMSNKLFFSSPAQSGGDLIHWIANKKASEAIEKERNQVASLRHTNALARLNKALNSCISKEVTFDLSTSPLALFIVIDGVRLDLNVLPDGLKSILSWLGDLLMRLDQLNTDPELDSLSQPFTLLLDEIDIHLHPSWQRRLLPMIQELFPNAQIFCSTHSPFVVNSVNGAWVHAIELDGPYATPQKPVRTEEGQSYATVLRQIFDTPQRFGPDVEQKLAEFYQLRAEVLKGDSGKMKVFEDLANALAKISTEVSNIVLPELRQLSNAIRREAAS